jgi:hypothetical protein
MGRPIKTGLDYFPVDVDFFEDRKIKYLFATFGLKGEAIALRLLCRIYRNGGFLPWNDDEEKLFIADLGKKISFHDVRGIIDECLKREFFNSAIYKEHQVLTSNGIQKRYFAVISMLHRKSTLPESFLVSSEETTSQPIVNAEKSAQIKRKEIKGNKIKGNESDSSENRGNSHFNNLINNSNGSEEITDADKELYRTFYPGK